MTEPLRVLVVDDSVVARRIVVEALAGDPAFALSDAASGKIALARLGAQRFDAVTLDVEMPEMDGIATLGEIRRRHPTLPVIMLSALTRRAAAVTIDALTRGATDYIAKPDRAGSPAEAREYVRSQLVPKLRALFGDRAHVLDAPATTRLAPHRIDVVAIGVSTGGPAALAEVVSTLPAGFPTPLLIVQHIPAAFSAALASRLAALSQLRVAEAVDGAPVDSGQVWLASGDLHLEVEAGPRGPVLRSRPAPPENSCRPSVDVLFRSIAAVYRANALAVVLTGMGSDGVRGCEALRSAGSSTIVQDAATSVVWGMPGAVARAGLAEQILPIDQIGPEIARRVAASTQRISLR